jgi:FixJ family two-component response regulator
MTAKGSKTGALLVFLIVDDPAIASAVAGILRTSGCRVNTFLSGSDLVACWWDEPPDVVVTDFVMQPTDGVRISAWVNRTYPDARVIMIAGDEMVVLPFPETEKPLNSIALIAAVHDIDLNETDVPDSYIA